MGKVKKRGTVANIALDASKQKKFNQKVHSISKDVKKQVKDGSSMSGVVYLSHLPWGFDEQPLKQYFGQFGTIRKLRLSRSKKTGNPRGFAYIQFAHDDVAKIAAEAMNNYLMFGKLIKCKHLLNPHSNTFKHANRKFIQPAEVTGAVLKHNSVKSEEAVDKSQKKMLGKLAKLHAKLAAQGIKYKLEDAQLSEVRANLQKKNEANRKDKTSRKSGTEDKEDDESDSDDDDDDDESDSSLDDTPAPATLKPIAGKLKGQKAPKPSTGTPKAVSKAADPKSAKKTNKRQSLVPKEVDTPKGKMNVLIEDSSEDEISFKTPPQSIKSSKLDETVKSMKGTPVSTGKRSPKRKRDASTPVSESKKAKGNVTPDVDVPMKKAKFLSKSAQKVNTPKISKLVKMPKSAQKMNTAKVDQSEKKEVSTPKNAGKTREGLRSGGKTPAKKTLPSETKRKNLK